MLPYIIFIVFILYFYHKRLPKYMLWTLILFAALRYNTGWDYKSYTDIISHPSYWSDPGVSKYSIAWRGMFGISNKLGFYHLGIVIPNILTYLCIYKGLKELRLSTWDQAGALLVYATWNSFYLGSFSTLRQAFAIGVGFLMFSYIQNRKIVKSAMCYVFAILLHTSAAVLIFLYLGYMFKNRLSIKWLIISIIVMIVGFVAIKDILIAISFLDTSQYGWYLNMSDNFGGKIIFVNTFMTAYLVVIFFINSKNMNLVMKQCYFFCLIAFAGNIVIYVLGLTNIIERILSYFLIFMIVILLPSLQVFRQRYHLKILAVIFLTLYLFVYLILTLPATKENMSGYIPYRCILIEQ